jgi:hypothetical protein
MAGNIENAAKIIAWAALAIARAWVEFKVGRYEQAVAALNGEGKKWQYLTESTD